MFCIFYYTILFNYNFRYSHFLKQNSFKVTTAPILDYFLLIKKNSLFPLIYQGLRVYLQQHCLYFLPLPNGFLICTILLHFKAFYHVNLHFYALRYTLLHSVSFAERI